jgi:hypothetical protein
MNEREFHSKLEAEFSTYLKTLGYPEGSLIYEPSIKVANRIYRPDFLIIDPANNERLAVIEVKGKILDRIESVKEQLNAYRAAIGDTTIPAFLATPSEAYVAEHPFDLFQLKDDGDFEKIDLRLFPVFSALSTNKAAEKKKEISDKKEEVTSSFESISRWIAALLMLLVVADFVCSFFEITLLTAERLTLLGGAVALIVIPYAQKFKGLGIEWEKATTKKEK